MSSNKRDQILNSALTLFIEQGFEKTPTSAISRHAGVATGTLFHHFKTKDDLINALYLEIKTEIRDATQVNDIDLDNAFSGKDPEDRTQQLKEIFRGLWLKMMNWTLQQPEKFRFMAQFGESAHISNNTRETAEELFKASKAMFSYGIDAGIFRPLPVSLLTNLMASHLFAAADYFINDPELWQQEDIQEQVFESSWRLMS